MKSKFSVIILSILLCAVYWRWFLPGPKVATDFPLVLDNQLKSMVDLPRVWSEGGAEGLGEYMIFFLWSWPLSFITGILANLGITFPILEKFFFLSVTLIIGLYGILKFTKYLNFSKGVGFVCVVFYLTNTYILLLVDGGQLSIGLTYAFFPISFLAVENSLRGRIKERIIAGIAVSVLGFLDIRFVYILLILCSIRFFYELLFLAKNNIIMWILAWFKTGLAVIPIFIGLNFYWLLPLLKDPAPKNTFSLFTQFSSSNLNLAHPFFLISPHWYKNIFGVIYSLNYEFVFIPLLVFLAPILRLKNRSLGLWLILAIISIFLVKGDAQPFSNLYRWIFNNIPYFSIFRDSTKFFVLVSLAYTALLGFTLEEIKQRIKSERLKKVFFLFIVLYLLFLARPVWLGWMTGTFSETPNQKEYQKLGSTLQRNTNFSRVLWIPSFPPLGYLSQNHPRVEATKLIQKRPFAIGVMGSYEFINFLREASYMGEVFNVSGIGYIVYPNLDPRRDDMHPDNIRYHSIFANQLSKLPWLTKVEKSPVPLWKVNKHQEKLFITPNTWWVIGSDDIYKEATKSSQLTLSKNALIFAEEFPDLGKRIDDLDFAKIVLYKKTLLDLAASFIEQDSLIFPAKNLKHDPDSSGWWMRGASDLIKWKDFLKTKYGINNQDFDLSGGWAVGEGALELNIKNEKFKKGKLLLARVLESTRSGQISFYQEEKLIGEINTKNPGDNVRWFEIGNLIKDGNLIVKTKGDINVINAIAAVPTKIWEDYKDKTKKYQNKIANFGEGVLEASPSVSFKQINPTKYLVTVENLKQPSMLVFSQNFDKNWKLNNQSPFPVYSLLNGYRIDKVGQYELNFEPQKYILPGLIISISILVVSLLLLLV